MNSELLKNRKFLLDQDLAESRFYQVYTLIDTQYVRILQSNSTNPRVIKLNPRQRNDYLGVTEKLPEYSVRIVKSSELEPLIKGQLPYFISFDNGNTAIEFYVTDIQESVQPGLYWTLILHRNGIRTINLISAFFLANTGNPLEIINTGDQNELIVW